MAEIRAYLTDEMHSVDSNISTSKESLCSQYDNFAWLFQNLFFIMMNNSPFKRQSFHTIIGIYVNWHCKFSETGSLYGPRETLDIVGLEIRTLSRLIEHRIPLGHRVWES